ncbi:HNH endonuclease [Paenibacillus lautus]
MEYQRKSRWANYGSYKCKVYLRNDFSHECAYCKLQEVETGVIDSNYFEIDHFIPQNNDDNNVNEHTYSNLYYSCSKCNREKSDKWSQLLFDPCKELVFSGDSPPIIGGYDPSNLYKFSSETPRGLLYINTFKLNSRHHIRIRKRRTDKKNNIRIIDELIDEILVKFRNIKKNSDSSLSDKENLLIQQLDELRMSKRNELIKLSRDENFELVEEYLNKRNIKNSIVFEEYNMDIKIKFNNVTYFCELIVDYSRKNSTRICKRIESEKLKTWFNKLSSNFGLLFFYPHLNKLYFFPVCNIINSENIGVKRKQITLTEEFLIV